MTLNSVLMKHRNVSVVIAFALLLAVILEAYPTVNNATNLRFVVVVCNDPCTTGQSPTALTLDALRSMVTPSPTPERCTVANTRGVLSVDPSLFVELENSSLVSKPGQGSATGDSVVEILRSYVRNTCRLPATKNLTISAVVTSSLLVPSLLGLNTTNNSWRRVPLVVIRAGKSHTHDDDGEAEGVFEPSDLHLVGYSTLLLSFPMFELGWLLGGKISERSSTSFGDGHVVSPFLMLPWGDNDSEFLEGVSIGASVACCQRDSCPFSIIIARSRETLSLHLARERPLFLPQAYHEVLNSSSAGLEGITTFAFDTPSLFTEDQLSLLGEFIGWGNRSAPSTHDLSHTSEEIEIVATVVTLRVFEPSTQQEAVIAELSMEEDAMGSTPHYWTMHEAEGVSLHLPAHYSFKAQGAWLQIGESYVSLVTKPSTTDSTANATLLIDRSLEFPIASIWGDTAVQSRFLAIVSTDPSASFYGRNASATTTVTLAVAVGGERINGTLLFKLWGLEGECPSGTASLVACRSLVWIPLPVAAATALAREEQAAAPGEGNTLYLFGGRDGAGEASEELWMYDLNASTLQYLGKDEGYPRVRAQMIFFAGAISYSIALEDEQWLAVSGGLVGPQAASGYEQVSVYSTSRKRWRHLPSPLTIEESARACFLVGHLHLFYVILKKYGAVTETHIWSYPLHIDPGVIPTWLHTVRYDFLQMDSPEPRNLSFLSCTVKESAVTEGRQHSSVIVSAVVRLSEEGQGDDHEDEFVFSTFVVDTPRCGSDAVLHWDNDGSVTNATPGGKCGICPHGHYSFQGTTCLPCSEREAYCWQAEKTDVTIYVFIVVLIVLFFIGGVVSVEANHRIRQKRESLEEAVVVLAGELSVTPFLSRNNRHFEGALKTIVGLLAAYYAFLPRWLAPPRASVGRNLGGNSPKDSSPEGSPPGTQFGWVQPTKFLQRIPSKKRVKPASQAMVELRTTRTQIVTVVAVQLMNTDLLCASGVQQLGPQLNDFVKLVSFAASKNEGVMDTLLGDTALLLFNGSTPCSNHFRCGLECAHIFLDDELMQLRTTVATGVAEFGVIGRGNTGLRSVCIGPAVRDCMDLQRYALASSEKTLLFLEHAEKPVTSVPDPTRPLSAPVFSMSNSDSRAIMLGEAAVPDLIDFSLMSTISPSEYGDQLFPIPKCTLCIVGIEPPPKSRLLCSLVPVDEGLQLTAVGREGRRHRSRRGDTHQFTVSTGEAYAYYNHLMRCISTRETELRKQDINWAMLPRDLISEQHLELLMWAVERRDLAVPTDLPLPSQTSTAEHTQRGKALFSVPQSDGSFH